MREQLEQIKLNALAALEAAETPAALEELRVKLLGKKGEMTAVLKQMGKLSAEERPVMGQMANAVRAEIEAKLTITKNYSHHQSRHCKRYCVAPPEVAPLKFLHVHYLSSSLKYPSLSLLIAVPVRALSMNLLRDDLSLSHISFVPPRDAS